MELRNAPDEDDPMLPEMEAAEALAALARCSAVRGGAASSSEDQADRMATSALISGVTHRNVPSKLCSQSNWWNSARKLRQNMTEDEKEKRRLCRILANRESARQTIRRRQATHLELTRKAVELTEENENLKKEKEVVVEEYNSLKGRNKFLKLQVANAKKAEPSETKQEPKSSQAEEKPTSATISSPVFLYNQPSLVSFFWPSVPSSNFVHLQYLSHSDVMSLSEFSLQHRDMSSSNVGNPLFVFPLPWALPFPSYSTMLHSCSDSKKRQNETPSAHQCSMSSTSDNLFVSENNELSSKSNMLMKAASSCTRSMPLGRAIGAGFTYPVNTDDHHTGHHSGVTLLMPEKLSCINSQEDNISDPSADSATDNMLETSPKKAEPVISHHRRRPVNAFAATRARRRRKELMMLKNVRYHHTRTHSANSSR